MARTALLCALPVLLIASGWSQLESPPLGGEIALVAALGVGVGLLSRRWLQALAAVAAFLVAANLAFGVSPLDARPFDDRDFFGPLVSGIWNGALDYYEITIPFDPNERPRMHGALLMAAFAFALGTAVAIGRRRAVLASALTFAGAAWPVTLIRDAPSTTRGTLLLVAALILLAALRPGAGRGTRQTVLAGAAVVVAALVAVSTPAVAKGGFLAWEQWEPNKRPERPVDVSYVWDADYDGIRFPKRPTTVLTVRAPRARAPYWRATTLDTFLDDHWRQDQVVIAPTEIGGLDVLLEDPLLPPDASDSDKWMEQEVTIHSLRDNHLVGATNPIAFERGEAIAYAPGVAHVERLRRGQDYRVWSYVRQPRPRQLARSPAVYPDEIYSDQFLGTGFGAAPPFGTAGRGEVMQQLFSDDEARVYKPLYDTALEVVGRPRNPYAAVVALEAWFRQGGEFSYDETPPVRAGVPPLVAFVNGHRRGYCQHFAGAMALMLRYLGIPARVGAGFTTGRYDAEDGEWTVSDTNAHTWVEVWFAGYGWLPFDPTPGRGRLRGSYTSSSFFFDVSGATGAFGVGAAALGLDVLRSRLSDGGRNAANDRARGFDPGGGADGQAAPAAGDGASGSLIGLLLVVAAALTVALWLLKLIRRHLRYLTRDPRRLAGAVRLDLVDYLVDQRVPVSSSATPAELSTELERQVGVVGERLAQALAAARYGPDAQAEDAARRARRELRAVRRRLRQQLGTWDRLRGLVSLRSFGLGSA
jgi:transglutaminase-like putative cysteine protease